MCEIVEARRSPGLRAQKGKKDVIVLGGKRLRNTRCETDSAVSRVSAGEGWCNALAYQEMRHVARGSKDEPWSARVAVQALRFWGA